MPQTVPPVRLRSARDLLAAHAIALLTCVSLAGLVQAQAAPSELMSAPPPEAQTPTCTAADLVRGGRVTTGTVEGVAARVQDGALEQEGAVWDSPSAVRMKASSGPLLIDLRLPRAVRYLLLQGDDNDAYRFEGSVDGRRFELLWEAPVSASGQGLRTRFTALPSPREIRFLRIQPVGGDGYYSISEIRAHCAQPTPWPPALVLPPKKTGWAAIDNPVMVAIKGGLAGFGTLLLLSYLLLRNRPHVLRRTRDALLILVGIASFASWWNLGHFHFDHYEHIWEHYHYYVGAKYGPELRYARLYECTAVADIEDGLRARVVKRKMRDLAHTNELGTSDSIVADPARCKSHFTPERWEEFRKDLRFFRGRFSTERWDQSQNDHGYNATPVWGLLARFIADHGELTWEKIQRIAYIDSALLVLMWVFVLWAFGWRAACAALLYWGTNFPARFYWTGGAMLRYDWLFWMVVGLCFLRKDKHFAGGLALTYATLLRVFPGFVVFALVLKALARMVRERRFVLSREHQWFAAGCITAMLVLIPISSWATGGLDAWGEFAENSQKHLSTALTNNMGLKTVLGYDFPTRAMFMRNDSLTDPFKGWKDARYHYYHKSQPILIILALLFCIMIARAGDREPDWSAACLGTGLILIIPELTCYYYGFLLTYGLMWQRHKLPGIVAGAVAGVSCWISELPWNDDHFTGMSLAYVIGTVLTTAYVAFGPSPDAEPNMPSVRPAKPESLPPVTPLPPSPDSLRT